MVCSGVDAFGCNGECICDPETDCDGIPAAIDNCPEVPNKDQLDSDADQVGDGYDNCPMVVNEDQADSDDDNIGDVCDPIEEVCTNERCNGIDDDCDGLVDESFELGEECITGRGECERTGVNICQVGGIAGCSAPAGDPENEVCNDQDDDCDRELDNDCIEPCEPQGDEVCNGEDDDCDGEADEEFVGPDCDAYSFRQISAANAHTCGVLQSGEVLCWGYNDNGRATPPEGSFSQVSAVRPAQRRFPMPFLNLWATFSTASTYPRGVLHSTKT